MTGFVRTKRVTDPLDARVRDRLVGRDGSELGYASSGSEHSADNDDSPCLSELVHSFLEDGESETRSSLERYDSDSERADSVSDRIDSTEWILRSTEASNADSYRKLLQTHVSQGVEAFLRLRSNKAALRRNVMSFLRDLGHNAAICKTRWDSSSGGSLTAGSYEFIDAVLQPSSAVESRRYFIDIDFATQFEIARPSPHYSRLLQSLPRIFIGNGDELKRIVRSMCDAAKRSLKSTELSIPPWRKNRYMQNKWFGPYRRTVNQLTEISSPSTISPVTVAGVKCRWVGFDNVVSDGNVNGGRAFVRIR